MKWILAGIWGGIGLIGAVAWRAFGDGNLSLLYLASFPLTGFAIGAASGYAFERLVRRFGRAAGGLIGQLVLAVPATQLAPWAATFGVQVAGTWHGGAIFAWGVYGAVLVAAAVAVLSAGSIAGMAAEAALGSMRQKLPARWAQPIGAWRPGWKALRIAVLLAMLAGALVYADHRVGLPWPEATPPEASAWIERERALFRGLLAGQRYDVLVLPVEADGPSFDRIARSLMTRYLALRTEERTGARLPDPTLLARALDARARSVNREDALRLAESTGARTVLASRVRRTGQTFEFRTQAWTRDGDGAPWREGATASLEALGFHDRMPPSVAFRGRVDVLLDQLKLGAARPVAGQAPAAGDEAPALGDLLRLATRKGGSAADRALRLQLLASLHERENIEAETLWERSLVALWRASGDTESDRVLEARAYMHLSRRPYALERLGAPASPAGRALLAALNGNVPELEAAAESISDRSPRLIAEIELTDLYHAYGLDKRLIARRTTLLEPAWTDPALLGFRLSGPDWFRDRTHWDVAAALRPLLPVELDWGETAAAWLYWLYRVPDPLGFHELRLARSIERRYAPAWKAKAAEWTESRALDGPAEWDYYELLFAANRKSLLQTLYATLRLQGLPQRALAAIESLGNLFSGYPRVMYFHAWALDRIGRDAPPGASQRLFSHSSALAVSAYRWEGGESHLSSAVEYYIYDRPFQKYDDEPLRWYREAQVPAERLHTERVSYGKQEMERTITVAARRLGYTDRRAQPLRDLVRWLRRSGRVEEAVAEVEASQHRFVGTVARAELLAEARESASRGEDIVPIYRELFALDPSSWDAHWRLARVLVESGKPGEAQALLLGYPGFKDREGHNVVGLSNQAFEAGHYLHRQGEDALAEPLFRVSNQMATWSAREIHARELVAIRSNDVDGAIGHARYQVERYSDSRAATRYLMYQFLRGRNDSAWAEFDGFANRFGNEDVWAAAFMAHRMQGIEGRALEEWLLRSRSGDTRRDYLSNALRERHAFMLAFLDRPPSEEAAQLVRTVARANNNSPFYPQLADGYRALRGGDFAVAAQKLRGPHNDLFNIGVNRRSSHSEWLPYLAYAYARSGQGEEAEKLVRNQLMNLGADFDYLAARALLEGAAGRHDQAAAALRRAFHRLPEPQTRVFAPGYALLEACELLLQASSDDRYRALIEEFAGRLQVEVPYAWAAGFEAKYARERETRQIALAAALVLDPKSSRITQFTEAERAAARGFVQRHHSVLGAAMRQRQR